MQHLYSFDQYLLEEAIPTAYDSTIIPALGKNIYRFLRDKGFKVQLNYQNQSLGQKGKAKYLGNRMPGVDYLIATYPQYIIVQKTDSLEDEEIKQELMSKFASDDIDADYNSRYNQVTFTLKEMSREREASRDRMKEIPNQPISSYDMMTKANRTQREKGYSGISKQYNRAIKPEENIYNRQ